MSKKVPKISVIIPACNIDAYITETLSSLQRQSFSSFEALVVDDGSSDNTAQKVKTFAERDARFRLLQKENGGLSSARNFGMQHASADYIALLDGDDLYRPEKLERHVAILDERSDVGVVYSASQAIRDDGKPTPIRLSGKPIYEDPLTSLLCKNFVGHGSNGIFRKCILAEVGDFDETLRSCEDVDFWLRVAATRRWQFYRDPKVLCGYRVRPSGLSFNVEQMCQSRMRVIESARQRTPGIVEPILPTARAYVYRFLSRLSLSAGNRSQAKTYIDLALAEDASIFYRDPRSLITLLSVKLMPIADVAIKQILGRTSSAQK